MHLAVVVNDRSGRGIDSDRVGRLLERAGGTVSRLSMGDLDGGLSARVDRLVIAGGDGSIGVAARAAHLAGIPLAVLAIGTANDFARALALPTDVEGACALAADDNAPTRHCEIGMFGSHPFVNAAAAGLSTVASRHARPLKPRLGPLAYPVGAAWAGLTAHPVSCRVVCDGTTHFAGDVWQVVVAATGAFGGGSAIGGTRHDDGELDVAIVPAGRRLGLVGRAYGMRRRRLTAQRGVGHVRGRAVEIDLPPGIAFNVDGDLRENHPARFSLLPGGVDVVVAGGRRCQ